MRDPTYVKDEIDANITWKLAYQIGEHENDTQPLGWGKYIPLAESIIAEFDVNPKLKANKEEIEIKSIHQGLSCANCGKYPSKPMHPCPYKEELYCDETECNCCDLCSDNCSMDI